jgi:hypothetical protein
MEKRQFLIFLIIILVIFYFFVCSGSWGNKLECTLNNPFIVGVLLLLFGKLTIIDKILARKSLDIKFSSINKIITIRNKLKEANFFYDRYLNSLELIREKEDRQEIERKMKILEKDLDGVGKRLFEDIPLLLSHFETEIELYLKDRKKLEELFNDYRNRIFEFINFYAELPKKIENFKKSYKYDELDLNAIKKKEDNLIEKLKQTETIFD